MKVGALFKEVRTTLTVYVPVRASSPTRGWSAALLSRLLVADHADSKHEAPRDCLGTGGAECDFLMA